MKDKIIYLIKQFYPFVKYCIVGLSGTFIDLVTLYILVEYAGVNHYIATSIAFLLAVINNFFWNKYRTFSNKSKNYLKQYIKFFLVSLVGYLLTISLFYLLKELFNIYYMFAKLIITIIVVFWNFLANKYRTFKVKQKIDLNIPQEFDTDLSIIIPALNEQNSLRNTMSIIDDYLKELSLIVEVIIVNDGSTDNTQEILEKLSSKYSYLKVIHLDKNQGKGNAVRTGVIQSIGKYILFADADNSTPIQECTKFYEKIESSKIDIVIGSRYLKASNVQIKQPFYRVMIGRLGNIVIRMFLINNIADTQCGFKMFKHKAAKDIFSRQKVKRWGFDMEILTLADMLGYSVTEFPVSWFNSSESRIRPIRDAFMTLWELIYIKLNVWSGRYK